MCIEFKILINFYYYCELLRIFVGSISAMFATISRVDSVRKTAGRPVAFEQALSMVCPHDFDKPCTNAAMAEKEHPAMSNTVRMYNKLMCGKSFCPGNTDAGIGKII